MEYTKDKILSDRIKACTPFHSMQGSKARIATLQRGASSEVQRELTKKWVVGWGGWHRFFSYANVVFLKGMRLPFDFCLYWILNNEYGDFNFLCTVDFGFSETQDIRE